jgi:phosphoribosylformylglycinamidine synthase subunit PurS
LIRAHVMVSLKEDVMDPQGNAVAQALESLGHRNLRRVRVGRYFDLAIEGDDADAARAEINQMCEQLLANTVIEKYAVHLESPGASAG